MKSTTEKPVTRAVPTKRLPYGFVGKMILGTVAVAGIVSLALVAPGTLQAVRLFERGRQYGHRRPVYLADVRATVQRLRKKKWVIVYQSRGETVIRLTERGKQELSKYELQEKSLQKKKWDRKWRLLIFDIAERRRGVRDRVRKNLRAFGLVKLQESVWVYPYECEDVVTLLKADNHIAKDLLYIVAGEIENDAWLKKRFGLNG